MHMFVLVFFFGALVATEGKSGGAAIVEDFMQNAMGFKRTENAVKGNAVELLRQYLFNIGLAESFIFMVEYVQDIGPLPGKTKT